MGSEWSTWVVRVGTIKDASSKLPYLNEKHYKLQALGAAPLRTSLQIIAPMDKHTETDGHRVKRLERDEN